MENLSAMGNKIGRSTWQWTLLLLCFFAWPATAQNLLVPPPERAETRKGNQQYDKENYTDAEASYKKALDKKNNMPEATFNLGDAVYKQKRYDEAIKQFQNTIQNNPDPLAKAKAWHNIGNAYLEQRKWEDAIKSYKEALKINPNDQDTKYNLAYANSMMIQQKKDEQKKKDDKKDKDKDKDKDKKDDKKDQQQNKNPDSGKPDDKQGNNEQKRAGGQMTKEQAEKLLQALQDEEQKTNQKVQQKQMKPVNVKIQKDW